MTDAAQQLQLIARPLPPSEPDKTIQKAVFRRVVDAGSSLLKLQQARVHGLPSVHGPCVHPTMAGALELLLPSGYPYQPASSIPSKFAHVSQAASRAAINAVNWTVDGRRCVTGTNTGEIYLWSGDDFVYETRVQAAPKPVRHVCMAHNGNFVYLSDDSGAVRVLTTKLAPRINVAAHKDPCRAVTLSPQDHKFATGSDDTTIKVWDAIRYDKPEHTLLGHGGDVRYVEWHPRSCLLASASKDALVKLWDPRTPGEALASLHGHKSGLMQVRWSYNGHWVLTASRDHTLKVFDVRTQKELANWAGHNKEVLSAAWHPIHEDVAVSGDRDGTLCCWMLGQAAPQATILGAHEGQILNLAWHPVGHLLASVSFDSSTKFWCRARPGDPWHDAQQQEQEQFSATYATAAPGGAGVGPPGGFPGPGGAAGGGGGGAAAGAAGPVPGLGGDRGGLGAKPIPGLGGQRAPPPGIGGPPGLGPSPAAAAAAGGLPPPHLPSGPPMGPPTATGPGGLPGPPMGGRGMGGAMPRGGFAGQGGRAAGRGGGQAGGRVGGRGAGGACGAAPQGQRDRRSAQGQQAGHKRPRAADSSFGPPGHMEQQQQHHLHQPHPQQHLHHQQLPPQAQLRPPAQHLPPMGVQQYGAPVAPAVQFWPGPPGPPGMAPVGPGGPGAPGQHGPAGWEGPTGPRGVGRAMRPMHNRGRGRAGGGRQ